MSRIRSNTTNQDRLRCVFCNGAKCKRCGDQAYLQQAEVSAIPNFHSTWITENIMAMQRPSDTMFDSGLLEQFVTNKIVAVFNLTEPGEHPYCGHGIIASTGFSYTPEKLMNVGIKHFNYSWPDMTVPSMSVMRDIVNVARCELFGKAKIAVHCHAGFGRTGIVVACILIACHALTADMAIELVRLRRPGSIQTSRQELFVREFAAYHRMMLIVFDDIIGKEAKSINEASSASLLIVPNKTVAESVRDQAYILPVSELASTPELRWLPKVVIAAAHGFKRFALNYPFETFSAFTGLAVDDTSTAASIASPLPLSSNFVPFQMNGKYSASSKSHLKLCSKMKNDANGNKWMLIETAVDMMTHAHITTEPETGRRRAQQQLHNPSSHDMQAKETANASASAAAAAATMSTTTIEAGHLDTGMQSHQHQPNQHNQGGSGQFSIDTSSVDVFAHSRSPSTRATMAKQQSRMDADLFSCSCALAQCFLDWIDCRSDVIFSEITLLTLHRKWLVAAQLTATESGKLLPHSDVPFALSGRYDVVDNQKSQTSAASGSVVDRRSDSDPTGSKASRIGSEPRSTARVTFDESQCQPVSNASPAGAASANNRLTHGASFDLPGEGLASMEETVESFLEKELAVIANPADIASELDKTFGVIESASSKHRHAPAPLRSDDREEYSGRHSAAASVPRKHGHVDQQVLSLSKSQSGFMVMTPSASLGLLSVPADIFSSAAHLNGVAVDMDALNLFNTVYSCVESQLDRYQLHLLNVLVQLICRLRIGLSGANLGVDTNAGDLSSRFSARMDSIPKESLSSSHSKDSDTADCTQEQVARFKIFVIACLRVAVSATQPHRILIGDYLMTDHNVTPAVASAFDDISSSVSFRSLLQDRLSYLESVRQRVCEMAVKKAHSYAKYSGSDPQSPGLGSSSMARILSNQSQAAGSGNSGTNSNTASPVTDFPVVKLGIIRRASNRISGLISSFDITPRLRSISNSNLNSSVAAEATLKASDSKPALAQVTEGVEGQSERTLGTESNFSLSVPFSIAAPVPMTSPRTPRGRKKTGSQSPVDTPSPGVSVLEALSSSSLSAGPSTNASQQGVGDSSPDIKELAELSITLVNRAFFVLNVIMVLIDNQWSYTGPKNRLRLRSSHSGGQL